MNLKESIILALKQLLSNKGRTFLTMLGMFIGIGSVIMILGLGEGFKSDMKSLGANIGMGKFVAYVKTGASNVLITQEDLDLILSMPEIDTVMGGLSANGTTYDKDRVEQNLKFYASEPEYTETVNKIDLLEGRSLKDDDARSGAKAVIVPDILIQVALGTSNYKSAIGEVLEFTINNQSNQFEIIGVYKTDVSKSYSQEQLKKRVPSYNIYMPMSTLDTIIEASGKFGYIEGSIKDEYDQKEIALKLRTFLNKRHQQKDAYEVISIADQVEMINSMLDMITLFIGSVAGISLVVGGVGIMNIMLVTVKERTREIGIRKALGATNKVILRQFLIEALMLTLIAGIIGMLIGYVGAMLVGAQFDIPAKLTAGMVALSVGTSIAIGLIFGVYPAYQASNLEPVEALRYD